MNYRIIVKSLREVTGRDRLTILGMTVDRVYFIQQRSWKTLFMWRTVSPFGEYLPSLEYAKERLEAIKSGVVGKEIVVCLEGKREI